MGPLSKSVPGLLDGWHLFSVAKREGGFKYWTIGSTAFLTETPTVFRPLRHKTVTHQRLALIYNHTILLTTL